MAHPAKAGNVIDEADLAIATVSYCPARTRRGLTAKDFTMTDLQQIIAMLAKSSADFNKRSVGESITVTTKNIEFNFNKDGEFKYITTKIG